MRRASGNRSTRRSCSDHVLSVDRPASSVALIDLELQRPFHRLSDAHIALREFGPNWFTVTMGTGILSLTLAQFAHFVPLVRSVGEALWVVNAALFALFVALTIVRIVRWPDVVMTTLSHPVQSMFLGAIPMGFATMVNGIIVYGVPIAGEHALQVAYWAWIVDAALAVASGFIVPAFMFTSQEHALERMTAMWLLPVVPAEVAAATAGLIAPHMTPHVQHLLLVAGTLLWAFSVPLALAILAILFLRLALWKLPGKELGVSGWLTIGPLGTGSLAATLLGRSAPASGFEAVGLIIGLVLWGYGTWWWIVGILGTIYHARTELPFNMGWWGFTFPLGVYTAATYALASALDSRIFLDVAALLTVLLAALWLLVAIRTAIGAYRGDIFSGAPTAQPRDTRVAQTYSVTS